MANTLAIVKALNAGRLHEARTLVSEHMTESKDQLITQGTQYIAQSLFEAEDTEDKEAVDESEEGEDDEESDGEGDEYDSEDGELDEKIITKVDSKGKKTKRKQPPKGYKYIDGKLQKVSADEKRARSKGAVRGARKKQGQKGAIKRKTAKAKKKRESLGVK